MIASNSSFEHGTGYIDGLYDYATNVDTDGNFADIDEDCIEFYENRLFWLKRLGAFIGYHIWRGCYCLTLKYWPYNLIERKSQVLIKKLKLFLSGYMSESRGLHWRR